MTDYDYKNSTVLSVYICECLTVHHKEYIDGYKVQQDNAVQCAHKEGKKDATYRIAIKDS